MCPLMRRGRAIARGEGVLTGWMYWVGCAYNSCWEHDSLRVAAEPGSRLEWAARTPVMAAGLTDHRWTMHELLSQPIPLPLWVAPSDEGDRRSEFRPLSQSRHDHGSVGCYQTQ